MRIVHARSAVFAAALVLAVSHAAAQDNNRLTLEDLGHNGQRRLRIQNAYFTLELLPAHGGRITSLVHKRTGADLTRPLPSDHAEVHWGLLSDQVWQESYWHSDWNDEPYSVQIVEQTPDVVRVRLSATSDIWTGITIAKTITAHRRSSTIDVAYELSADDRVDPKAQPDFWFHQTLPARGQVFAASPAGVQELQKFNQDESWVFEPTRGWTGWLSDQGNHAGLAVAMSFDRLKFIRATHRETDTVEWVLRKVAMTPSENVEHHVTLAPFTGLQRIDGISPVAAVAIDVGPVEKGKAKATIDIAPFVDMKASITLELRKAVAGHSVVQTFKAISRDLKADKPARVEVDVPIAGEGTFVLAGVVESSDRPATQFERAIVAGNADGAYAMAPLGPRIPEHPGGSSWQRYSPKDLDYSSMAVQTPHRDWAPRYAGGRPRVLVLLTGHQERQIIELAQRFDMDLTASFLSTKSGDRIDTYYVLGDRVRSLKERELHDHVAKVLERDYDVIITSTSAGWDLLQDSAKEAILEKVRHGTGLVIGSRGKGSSDLADILPFEFLGYDWASGRLEPTESENPLGRALPFAAMAVITRCNGSKLKPVVEDGPPFDAVVRFDGHGKYPAVGISQLGEGRIVQSTLGSLLLPSAWMHRDPPAFDYWEYEYALLARLVYWAAKKESPVTLLDVSCTPKAVNASVRSSIRGRASATVTLRDAFGDVTFQRRIDFDLKDDSTIGCDLPAEAVKRSWVADVIIENEGGVLAWGGGVVPAGARGPTTFATFKPEQAVYNPTDTARFIATFNGEVPLESSVRASLIDGSGRVVARTEVDAFDETRLELPLSRVIGAWYQVRAEYLMNGVVVDQTWCDGLIRVDRRPDLLKTMFWGWGEDGPGRYTEHGIRQFVEMGMNANFGNRRPEIEHEVFNRLNMAFSAQAMSMYANAGTTKAQRASAADAEKPPPVLVCANPETAVKMREKGAERGEANKDLNVLMYSMGDENRGPPKDVGFSDVALNSFRDWLRTTQYASLDQLNASWKTRFASWDQVMPMTEDEVRAHGGSTDSFAPWADHRMFIKHAYSTMGQAAVEGITSADPRALVGTSGTQESNVYGGRDYWHKARTFTALAAYGGSQTIEHISFNPDLVRYPWSGYSKPAPIIRPQLWTILGQHARGFAIFSARNHINPDFTLPEAGRDLRAALLQINRGPGQLFISAQMAHDGVYILQSPQSIHGAYITGKQSQQRTARAGVENLLVDLAIGYRAISYEQLADGYLERWGAKALVLPWSVALSPRQCQAIERWVESGGTLIADFQPGVMDEHCVVQPAGQLDALMGVDRSGASIVAGAWQLTGAAAAGTLAAGHVETGVKATSATAMLTASLDGQGEHPVLFQRQVGRGRTIYLGFDALGAYTGLRNQSITADGLAPLLAVQDVLEKALADAGVTPAFTVRRLDSATGEPGPREPWIETRVKDDGPIRLIVAARDYASTGAALDDTPAALLLPAKSHLYDVLDGAYLGHGDRLDMTVVNNTLRVLALLPYRVDAVTLKAPSSARLGDNVQVEAQLVTSGGAVGRHWLRLDVVAPDGKAHRGYSTNLNAQTGRAQAVIPLTFNDLPGLWTICVTDVVSGVQSRAVVAVR